MSTKISNGLKKINLIAFLALVAVFGIAPLVSAKEDCAQVITNAVSSSGECKAFPTPCDVPKGWTVVSDCPTRTNIPVGDIKNSLQQMRADLKAFSDNKKQEESEKIAAAKEKVAARRKLIEAKREDLRIKKEEKRKAVLVRLLEIQIKQFENTKDRVAKMPKINAESKASLSAAIDSAITVLTAKKSEMALVATPEQLKALAKEIKDLFKAKREAVKQIVNSILASRTSEAIIKAETQLAELNVKAVELKTAGKDTASIEALLAGAKTKIETAKTLAADKKLKEAAESLKAAYKDIKSAASQMALTEPSEAE